jgi:hypothetical protein
MSRGVFLESIAVPSFSQLKWLIGKGLPGSNRTEESLFRTLVQNSRKDDESGTSSRILVESFGSLMLSLSLSLDWNKKPQNGSCFV